MRPAGVKWLAAGLVAGIALGGAVSASAASPTTSTTTTTTPVVRWFYLQPPNDDPGLIRWIGVRGAGCLQAEDATRLRLVRNGWQPSGRKVIYRCIQP